MSTKNTSTDIKHWFRELIHAQLPVRDFQREALRETIQWCNDTIPYYHETFARLPLPQHVEDLAAYPLLNPSLITKYQHPLLSRATHTDFVVFSGGTTTNSNKYIHRNFEEYQYLSEFRDDWYPRMGYGYQWNKKPEDARYVIIDDEHGIRYVETRRGPLHLLNFPLFKEAHFQIAKEVLTEHSAQHSEKEVVELRGAYPKVRLLTAYAIEHEWNMNRLPLKRVVTSGFFTSRRWQTLFQQIWGADLVQEYGLTEFHQSYANECLHCGWYHFTPIVVEEIVDRNNPHIRLKHGIGRLVLTHLFPTAMRQVLVRYDTGDLVEIGGVCPVVAMQQYKPIGRIKNMIELPTSMGLQPLSAAHFIEATDIPEASFHLVDLMQVEPVTQFQDIGAPKFHVWLDEKQRKPVIHLDVELKAEILTDHYSRIRTKIEDRLFVGDSRIRQYFETGDFQVEVHLVEHGKLTRYIPG